jgi:hypothetical protein
MPQIYQLPVVSQASLGDQLAVYTPNNGDARRMSLNTLLAFFQQQFASPTLATSIYTPTTGFRLACRRPCRSSSGCCSSLRARWLLEP